MTVKLDLKPDVEAGLLAQAEARGLQLEVYLELVLRERSKAVDVSRFAPMEKAKAFRTWAGSHPHTPPLSDDAIRRENLIRDGQ
jgi:hypothetical protein